MLIHESEPQVPGKHTGLTRIVKAGGYSLKGLQYAWQSEAAFRQECLLAVLSLALCFVLDLQRGDRMLLVAVTLLVLIAEILNSALEAVVDRVGAEYHELSGRAKDMGSAAVLLALLLWGYTWGEVLLGR